MGQVMRTGINHDGAIPTGDNARQDLINQSGLANARRANEQGMEGLVFGREADTSQRDSGTLGSTPAEKGRTHAHGLSLPARR
ncbi:hypothetical protein WI25_15395 [Burkholderia cepacia]|nr:hypothetical protein WI25_15395 [Burkholderia cepacia]